MVLGQGAHVRAEAPELVRACSVALFGDESAGRLKVRPAFLAVERQHHDPVRAREVLQDSPSLDRVAEMMQHARTIDDVEIPTEACEFENIRLRKADHVEIQVSPLPLGISKACEAEIDGEDLCIGKPAGRVDRVASCTATSDQNVQRTAGIARIAWQSGKMQSEPIIEREGVGREIGVDPARIGMFLVLPSYSDGHPVAYGRRSRKLVAKG